jgi:hypothetical protein
MKAGAQAALAEENDTTEQAARDISLLDPGTEQFLRECLAERAKVEEKKCGNRWRRGSGRGHRLRQEQTQIKQMLVDRVDRSSVEPLAITLRGTRSPLRARGLVRPPADARDGALKNLAVA